MITLDHGRPIGKDLEQIVSWLNDPVLMKYSEQRHKKHTVDTQRLYYQSMIDGDNSFCLVRYRSALIGTVSAIIDDDNLVANVGILISPLHVGTGLGLDIWRSYCDQLGEDGIRKIEGGCMSRNTAMIRIFEKNGMRLEGTRRYHFITGKDQYDDMVMYGKLL